MQWRNRLTFTADIAYFTREADIWSVCCEINPVDKIKARFAYDSVLKIIK